MSPLQALSVLPALPHAAGLGRGRARDPLQQTPLSTEPEAELDPPFPHTDTGPGRP